MSKRGIVIVISGPSGSGKGTVVKELRGICPTMQVSVSATTRLPREGETNGVEYYFKTREEFEGLIERGEVLEYTQYNGNYYGTLKSEAERIISAGDDLILEIEVDGGGQIKRLMGNECVSVMLIAPSAAEQESRLRGRGTESEEVIQGRLARAKAEIKEAVNYDYIVVNESGKQTECAENILAIIKAEHFRTERMNSYIAEYFE
ncbi:MAG: guanylate kinase [Clostridia bacterium]|nr:guanylate kinase [Oscillospiraceae bacterium]MBO4932756.1 guanylate kinase [Clostridia bacterium]MBO5127310.1 guanylate kinase [Clostridia bacterium]MBP3293149.1 guanylate kinase [Clostridia bacterium]